MSEMLGRGWKFPPCFDAHTRGAVMVEDVEDIEESLRILMDTMPGERVMRPDYGCDIARTLFESLDENILTQLREIIRRAILFFEPRISLDRLDVDVVDEMEGRLSIVLAYTVRTTNTRHNLVYPLYLKQATNPV